MYARYRYDMSVEEAAELGRRAIYHATFRDGASGGVASGNLSLSLSMNIHDFQLVFNLCFLNQFTMWVLTDGKSYLGMMSGSSTTHTIQ